MSLNYIMLSVILLNVVAPVGCFNTTLFFLFEKNGTTLGAKDKERYLFANIYGPNTKQDMFDENALNNIQNAVDKHGVHCLIVGGDLNVEIVKSQNRYISEYEQKALEIISEFCRVNNLEIVSDTENPTWFNKARSSKLDYILTNIKGHKWQSKNNWGVDKSDHSLID